MADATPDTTTPDISGLTPDQLSKYIAMLHLGQGLPNVQPDQTPVDTSGFWGGLRHGISLLGEAAGSPGPETLKALSPKEREQAGLQSLSRFGTGLLAASHYVPGQTFGSNLAQGFQAAEHGYDTTARQAMGMLAARQGYAVQSQQADLEKLKAALPLLSLQAQLTGSANTQKLLSGQVTPGTNIGSGGSIGDYTVPPALLPLYQQAAEKYGVPVELLIAQHKQESNLTPGTTGGAGEIGLGQVAPGTAKSPGFGMAGVDPKALRDPATNIDFSAQYLAARAKAAGADLRTPEGVTKALKAYNGGGDPNYVQNVTRYIPGAQKALAGGAPSPAPGQAGTPTPTSLAPSAPGAKTQISPPAVAAPGQATPPARGATIPSEPPLLAGGAQAAGGPGAPGAPTSGVIPTLPPAAAAASAADVAQIESGMANARANPITPGAQPGAVVTAQAGGQQPPATQLPPIKAGEGLIQHPGVYKDYFAREAAPVPTTEDFSPNLSPARQAQFNEARKGIQFRIANRMNLPSAQQAAEGTKIGEDSAALEASIQKEMADKSQAAAANTTAWIKTQDAAVRPRYEQELKDYGIAAQSTLTSQQKLDEIKATSDAGVDAASLKDLNASGEAARKIRDQTSQLMQISREAGDPSILTALPSVANAMGAIGLLAPEKVQQLGAQRAFDTGINTMIGDLRKQEGMSRMTDADLKFLVNTVGSSTIPEALRLPMLAVINSAADRHAKYVSMVNELRGIPGMTTSRARDLADEKLGHVIPTMPSEFPNVQANDAVGLENAQNAWRNSEVTPGTFYIKRKPDGTLKLSIRPVQDPSAQPQIDQR